MTIQIVFTERADADFAEILADIVSTAGLRTASKYNDLFEKLYDRLAEYPRSGAPRPRLATDVRIGIVSPYIVVYRYREGANDLTVLRILHGRRKIRAALLSG